jgi:phosphatidylglycerophosphate synthase
VSAIASDYPLSRWYLRPLAALVATRLALTAVRPWQVSACGYIVTLTAAALIVVAPTLWTLAAVLILASWFCDRLDGQLARRQGTASVFGAWLDANLDELGDVTLQTAFAYAASAELGRVAWLAWGAFITGKYLFMYGLTVPSEPRSEVSIASDQEPFSLGRWLYHLPANADVRVHLAAAAAFCGAWGVELAFIAAYYQLRWIARYYLVARRLCGEEFT